MFHWTEDELICWVAALALAFALAVPAGEDCEQYTEGTDMYHACMEGWEEIDLGIQDEADEPSTHDGEPVPQSVEA